MTLCEVFLGLQEALLEDLLRQVSLGKLKTYQLFDRVKTRFRVAKLNQESLRRLGPRLWERLGQNDEELASDIAQAVLVSHLDMIVAVLDFLEVPHRDGFFEKDAKVAEHLKENWQERTFVEFGDKFPRAVLVFYLNHLAHEVNPESALFVPGP